MNLSPHNFVTVDQILSDVLSIVDDSGMKMRSKGWYTSQIQQCLEELSFDTFLSEQNDSFDVPENLRLPMPKGAFNLRGIYLFNGNKCDINKAVNVYLKRNFINSQSGKGYVAEDMWSNEGDAFHTPRGGRDSNDRRTSNGPNNLFYYGMQNGIIMLSENCCQYQKVMLVYNGILADIGDVPLIPQFFRQAVIDWTSLAALKVKRTQSVGTQHHSHWTTMIRETDVSLNKPFEGSWAKAELRAKKLDRKSRNDIKEYMTSLNY